MINPDAEVNRLRSYLSQRDWYQTEIDEICDLCHNDINEIMLDIISNAVAEATDYAIELGAEEFIEDLDVVEIGGGYMIGTRSGKTDYSVPERKMLPDLVKNGEVSEDGDRYKVIPVGKDSGTHQPRDIFSVLQQRDRVLQDARKTLNQQSLDNRSERAQRIAGQWRCIIAEKMKQVADAKPKTIESPINKRVDFRTASEKQDPDTTWVIPAKEMDMTGYLMDMNKRIQDNIYQSVMFIVESYEKEFA
jgi:hypothetical protein